jgi:hypothetical protein
VLASPCTGVTGCYSNIAAIVDAALLLSFFVPITLLLRTRAAARFRSMALAVGIIAGIVLVVAGLPAVRAAAAAQMVRVVVLTKGEGGGHGA